MTHKLIWPNRGELTLQQSRGFSDYTRNNNNKEYTINDLSLIHNKIGWYVTNGYVTTTSYETPEQAMLEFDKIIKNLPLKFKMPIM